MRFPVRPPFSSEISQPDPGSNSGSVFGIECQRWPWIPLVFRIPNIDTPRLHPVRRGPMFWIRKQCPPFQDSSKKRPASWCFVTYRLCFVFLHEKIHSKKINDVMKLVVLWKVYIQNSRDFPWISCTEISQTFPGITSWGQHLPGFLPCQPWRGRGNPATNSGYMECHGPEMDQSDQLFWWFGTMEFDDCPFSWEEHHPNWLSLHHFSYFSEG